MRLNCRLTTHIMSIKMREQLHTRTSTSPVRGLFGYYVQAGDVGKCLSEGPRRAAVLPVLLPWLYSCYWWLCSGLTWKDNVRVQITAAPNLRLPGEFIY